MRLILICLAALLCLSLLPSSASALRPVEILNQLEREAGTSEDLEQIIAEAYKVRSANELRGVQVALIYPLEADANHTVLLYPSNQQAYPAASTVKVVLAVLAARYAAQANAGWDTKIGDSTLIAVTKKMIRTSDNASANLLLEAAKYDKLHGWLAKVGFARGDFQFSRRFGDFESPGDNTCTAFALAKFFFLLAQRETVEGFADRASLDKVRNLLDSSLKTNNIPQFNDRLNAKLPGVSFIHKTGSNNDVLADGGIFRGPQNDFILVVLDKTKNKAAMQRLGEAIYKRFND